MINDVENIEEEDGQDWHFTEVLEEEIFVDIRDEDKSVDEYWAQGWLSGFTQFHRYNSDCYDNRDYKVFPTRYRLREIVFSKSLRRVLNKNKDLRTAIRPLRITEKKWQLYKTYQALRHETDNPARLEKVYDYIKFYPSSLKELCVFKDDKLVACSIFEVGDKAMFSKVAFWDLDETPRSLGILTVLHEMKYGQNLGLTYYYLGHYFRKNPIYQYKTRFPCLELYDWDNDCWIDFKNPSINELLMQKLPCIEYDDL